MAPKGKGKGKGPELTFDEKARAEYLTGFRKRKQERKQAGREYLAKKAKEEQLAARKELREARKEKAVENVREQRKAFGLEAEGESDLDVAGNSDDEDENIDDDEDVVPQIQEEEYDSDEHHTHVVVESFDPEQEAFEKATAVTASSSARKPKANGTSSAAAPSPSSAATTSVEALPPSSRRVNKAKANASLSLSPSSPLSPISAACILREPLSSQPFTHDLMSNVLTRYVSSDPTSFVDLLRTTGQSEETNHAHQEEDVSQKRLHISGLTATFSQEDLIRRFSTFGTVVSLDGLGKRDALGQFRPYAYLTLEAPPQQIKRCMNLLSGSMWKGATLRIGEAKPDYQERIQLEQQKRKQEEEEKANMPRKHKRLPPGMGVESYNMEPVDQEAVEKGLAWGWKRTPAGHLVRPLRMRPSHPLPRPSRASTLARANASEEDGEEDQQEEATSSRRARVNPRPPTKAHRITIDPTRYGAIHLSGPLLESLAAETGSSTDAFDVSSLGPGEWHCEGIDDEQGDAAADKTHRLVRWQYVAKDGAVLHDEFTKLPIRVVPVQQASTSATADSAVNGGEDVMGELDFDQYSNADSDDDLFSGLTSSLTPAKPQVEAKQAVAAKSAPVAAPIEDEVDTADIDDLFAGLSNTAVPETNVNDLFSDLPSTPAPAPPAKRAKVDKPAPVATPTSSKKVKGTFVPGLDPEEKEFSDGYDEAAAAGSVRDSKQVIDAAEERSKTLALLGAMFGDGSDDETPVESGVAEIAADDDQDSESDSSSESSSDSDSSSGVEAEVEAEDGEADEVAHESSSSSSSSSPESDDAESSEEEDGSSEVEEASEPVATAEPEAEVGVEDVEMDEAPQTVSEVVAPAPTDAKSRRAAFLSSLSQPPTSSQTQSGSFVPIARFDPGTLTSSTPVEAEAAPIEPSAPAVNAAPHSAANPAQALAIEEAQGTKVSMSTLKEMFKPQDRPSASDVTTGFSLGLGAADGEVAGGDSGGGFSLMDSLGLEFELEEEEPELEPVNLFAQSLPAMGASRWQQHSAPAMQVQPEQQQRKLGPFFPSSTGTSSWNGGDSQGSVQRWLKPRSEEEKEKDWAKYKEELTKVIKKRHREAARKHKRNFKSMPQGNKDASGAGSVGAVSRA